MIVPRYYENLNVLHENTMPARAYYIPVSYTHLDVYKRQAQNRRWIRIAIRISSSRRK